MTLAYADAPQRLNATLHLAPAVRPYTIVLQPSEALNQTNSLEFQLALENALEQVTDGVIVDLLWVASTDAYGIAAFVAGLQRAAALGKFLSFQAMDASSEVALEDAWAQQQECNSGAWTHTFSSDLESFLDDFTHG
jgi:anti-anti-sigma regulatory factor